MTFDQALRVAGLLPNVIADDGKWRRCKTVDKPAKKNGAYALYADGRGFFKNWATDDGMNAWRDDNATQARPIDMERVHAQRARDRQYRIQAVHSARAFWGSARPLSLAHPYFVNKGLSPVGCKGLRTHDGLLVVPVFFRGNLISVQTISADGTKRFWPGAPVKAGSFVLKRDRAPVTVLCEGLATGLAIFQSVRTCSVIVAFDAGNLVPVAEELRPTGSVVVAADNDWQTHIKRGTNPGIEKGTNVAELIGAGVAYPEGIEGSDWADFLKQFGQGADKRIERAILGRVKYVMADDP
jgi:putative DNA primase/helicase